VIRGGTGSNTIYGGTGGLEPPVPPGARVADDAGDELVGGAAADSIFGEEGNDVIAGGGGSDAIAGGSGVNLINGRLEVRGTDRPERINVFRDLQTETICGRDECFSVTTVDDIVVKSSSGAAPAITLGRFTTAAVASLDVDVRGGNDRIEIDASIAVPTLLRGGAGHDAIQGGGGIDAAFGDVGIDLLIGDPADLLDGGVGVNISLVAGRLDFMGTDGPERFDLAAAELFTPCESGGSLRFSACQDAVRVQAINGANGETATFLVPLTAVNSLHANSGGGDDTIFVAAALSTPADFDLGPGHDFAQAGSGPTTMHGGGGDDQLMGGPGNDAIFGEADDDVITCGGGSDELDGGPGVNDVSCGDNHPPTIDPISNYVVDEGSTLTFTVTATDSDNDSSDEPNDEPPTPTFVGPITYLSQDDSPFGGSDGGADFAYFHLEDFEDGELNVPGVTASAGAVIGPSGPPASPAGLMSRYRAEGNAEDSADGNDGTLQNGAAFATGKFGQAFRFDGVDDFVDVPQSDNLNFPDGSLTMEGWIFRINSAPVQHVAGKREGCGGDLNYYQLAIADGQGTIPPSAVPPNAWTHVAITVDGSTKSVRSYANGDEVGSVTVETINAVNSANLRIGTSGTCGDRFAGLVDEFTLHNRALSAAEIAANFDAGTDTTDVQTQIYSNNFEGAIGSEWSRTTTDTTPVGSRRFLGQFGSEAVTLSLGAGSSVLPDGLPVHEQVTVSFDLFVIRTWDGNGTGCHGPDIWDLSVAGGPTLLHTTFNNAYPGCEGTPQAFPDAFPGGSHDFRTGAVENNTLGFTFPNVPGDGVLDSVYNLTFTFPHSASSVAFDFTGMLSTPGFDESWGLDNVNVSLQSSQPGSVPVPDSVDGDDGAIDGDGSTGHSFRHDDATGITFTFDPETLGGLPTHVGIVWTDGGAAADVDFEAFDADGVSLGIARGDDLGDTANDAMTAEDRFFGVTSAAGISAITIRDSGGRFIEVDHLQFGRMEQAPPPPPPPAQTLRFSLDPGAPAGASIDPETGVFAWLPSETQGPRDHSVTVRVADDGSPSLSTSQTFTITVNEVNEPPSLGHIHDQTVTQAERLKFTADSTDPDLPANGLSFSLDAGAAAGAAIDSSTGKFTWTPLAGIHSPGVYEVTVRVTDRGTPALSDSQVVAITVEADVAPPTIDRVKLNSNDRVITEIVLIASESLDPVRATDVTNYRLIGAGNDDELGTADDVSAQPASAVYDAATHAVRLTPKGGINRLTLNRLFGIVVSSPSSTSTTGLTDLAGNPLDGDRDDSPGGDFVASAGRSKDRLLYHDSTGDTVALTISRGSMDLLVGASGEAIHLSLHDGPGVTALTTRVRNHRNAPSTTTIQLVSGAAGIQVLLPPTAFLIQRLAESAVDDLLASGDLSELTGT
jgi:Ca2+-binding RTX toxin-like protein